MQSLDGWNLSSAFLNLGTENGSSCAARFKGCQWTCLLLGGGSWFAAGVSYEASTHGNTNESQKRETGGILTPGSCYPKAMIHPCPSYWSPLGLHWFKPSFCYLQPKVLANAFVSNGDQSIDWNLLLWKQTYKKAFLLFGYSTELQRDSTYHCLICLNW